jgi:hypothetical protein|tara:strand:+ start:112 stop:336 length:225 start_codon:yes stop_codon:yes gene_type:complete
VNWPVPFSSIEQRGGRKPDAADRSPAPMVVTPFPMLMLLSVLEQKTLSSIVAALSGMVTRVRAFSKEALYRNWI